MLHNSTAPFAEGEITTLDATDLARILKKSVSTIRSDISRRPGSLPPAIRIGARTLWLPPTVYGWLQDQERPLSEGSGGASPVAPSAARPRRRGRPTKAEQIAKLQATGK